ncbi:Dynein heavy chain 7, axonemal [Armadillidium vulgare]|nr:Dynein heavy chain 7, axonemal [Armadillidium vulgare]
MRGSPYIKPFEEEIKAWEEKLLSMQDILDSWVKVTWLYLEPIFSSEDIMKQMPVEGRKFSRVDSTWRDIMSVAVVDPRALVATDQPNMLERLQENNSLLEDIQKGLNNYLEKKRLFFPRFFFLSNDELLEILSETKDPQRVQPHLRKCFQGIDALNFSSLLEIEGMISSDGEMVQFSNRVIPGKARGLVEKWLLEVEEMMVQSLQDVMVRAMESYPQTPHQKWIIQWPEIDERIEEVVRLVKGELKPADRITLGNLIISYVHGRDVAEELKSKNVQSLQDFSWVSQLRYLWINELVQVHMIMTSIDYGYEYLGNTTRLVITPLTDRCFRTLMGALKHHLGGAPEGPAGTGKTETCKDLQSCCQSNGLAQSGSWACFDEFNRMELEVLSVVAQQVQCLQAAVVRGAQTFSFDGTTLVLNPSCNVFITMNPGKIIDTYKLCSEQLSSQSHYDYGMRAVKAVLLAASSLKLQCPSLPEVQIVLKAIKDVNLPKFLSQDVPLFEGIVNDLFPAQYSKRDEETVFEECIKETFANKNLQNVDWLTGKIMQLYNMILVRHGVMIVGDSLSGKTTAYQVLCSVIETLSVSGKLPNESGVQYKIINPKALTLGQLYGAYDPFHMNGQTCSYLKTLPEIVPQVIKDALSEIIDWLLPPLLTFVFKKCKVVIKTSEVYLFKVSSIIKHFADSSRKLFDQYLRQLLYGRFENFPCPEAFVLTRSTLYPDNGKVYDYFFDGSSQKWISWSDMISEDRLNLPSGIKPSQVIIPTTDTVRQEYFIKSFLEHKIPLLLLGPTGTGKSSITSTFLANLPKEKYIVNVINFSAKSSASQTQDVIMSKVDRRRKGVFGPAMGRKYVIFIDDVNLPQKEEFGAQPPIEFLRQWLDHEHFYDKKDSSKLFIAAMSPPGDGRNNIPERFLRHLNVLSLHPFDSATLDKIYGTIVQWHLGGHSDTSMKRLHTVKLSYQNVKTSKRCCCFFINNVPLAQH